MEKLYGLGEKDLRSSAKTRKISFGRKLFSLMSRECGYGGSEVAEYLHKDPSLVTLHAREGGELLIPIKELRKYLNKSQ